MMQPKVPFHISKHAQKALSAAQEARKSGSSVVAQEHLLLGLMHEHNVAVVILKNMGVEPQLIADQIRRQLIHNKEPMSGEPQFDPRAQQAIEFAYEEGKLLNSRYIGTEHILLGVLREEQNGVQSLLSPLGVTLEKARAAVKLLQSGGI